MNKSFFLRTIGFALLLSAQVMAKPTPPGAQTEGALLELGVSGQPGANGQHGQSYGTRARPAQEGVGFFMNSFMAEAMGSTGDIMRIMGGLSASGGHNGRDGGNAGPAQPGKDAGSIHANLSFDRSSGKISGLMIVDAQLIQDKNSLSKQYSVRYGNSGSLYLYAMGGKGGNGGNGGDGEAGSPGSSGQPASRHIPGGNGGNGGNGGDGGLATSGASGGLGGKITVTVLERDAALLMLVKPNVRGGHGGDPGDNGQGGEGGPGGKGGAPASGFDTKTRTAYRTAYRTVSDGNGGTRSESYQESYTETYQEPWFTPGGFDGSRGSHGRNGNAAVTRGANGDDGSVEYVLQKEDGTVLRSSESFKLRLTDFHFDGMDGNGILEPGETVTVSRIVVRNEGGLPTPAHQKTKVYIAAKDWVVTDGTEIEIPRSLAPGESYTLDGNFQFKIQDTHVETEGVRMVAHDRIEPIAHILEVNRNHEDFNLVKDFEITFPVEISAISGLRSLAPGEETIVRFEIKNISTRDLGSLSELKRLVQHTLHSMGGNMDVSSVMLTSSTGKEIRLSDLGTRTSIDLLKPNESFMVEGKLKLSEDAEPFTQHTVRASLGLQHPQPDRASEITNVQNRDLRVAAAQTFRPSEKPGILLVTNAGTQIEEAKAWTRLGAQLGLPVDIWDASYYGRLPLLEDIHGQSMAERYKNKTIVILDNEWSTSQSATMRNLRNSDLLKKNEFLKVAASYGINTLIVGSENSAQKILERFYFPTEGKSKAYPSVPALLKAASQSVPEALGDINESFADVDFGAWQFFGKPRVQRVERAANRLEPKLARLAPSEQLVISYNIDPTISQKALFGLFKKYHLGTIQIRRTLSRDIGLVASVSGRGDAIHQASFVTSEENLFSFFTALPAESRAQLISRAFTDEAYAKALQENDVLDSLVNATLADIAIQQAKATRATINEHVPVLDLITQKLEGRNLPAANQEVLVNFLGHLSYFASSQVRWWMFLVPMNDQHRISNFINGKVNPILNSLSKGNSQLKKTLLSALKKKVSELRFADTKIKDRSKTVFRRYANGYINGSEVHWDDIEALANGKIYTADDIAAKKERDERRLSQQSETEALLKSEKAELLTGGTATTTPASSVAAASGGGRCEDLFVRH